MELEVLFIICFVCLIVMICVSITNAILTINTRKQMLIQEQLINQNMNNLGRISNDIEVLASKLQQGLRSRLDTSAISILDLAEFNDLTPRVKSQYKKYVVNILAPVIMDKINKSSDNISDKEIATAVYSIFKSLQ